MKKKVHHNFRIEVCGVPSKYANFTEAEQMEHLRMLEAQIRRHTDCDSAIIMYDTSFHCSYCGYDWEEDRCGMPLCCEKAIQEWEASNVQHADTIKV